MKHAAILQDAPADPYARLSHLMALLEVAMKEAGYWTERAPPPEALASVQPFAVDTLPVTAWLQWIFIPRVYRLARQRDPLPPHSDVFTYAEECIDDPRPAAHRVLALVKAFDAVINEAARRRATRH